MRLRGDITNILIPVTVTNDHKTVVCLHAQISAPVADCRNHVHSPEIFE
jgi:hypothetical protein